MYWQSDDQPKELNFFSISSDGRVASWVMSKNELKMEPVMQLKLVNTIKVSNGIVHNCTPTPMSTFAYFQIFCTTLCSFVCSRSINIGFV